MGLLLKLDTFNSYACKAPKVMVVDDLVYLDVLLSTKVVYHDVFF